MTNRTIAALALTALALMMPPALADDEQAAGETQPQNAFPIDNVGALCGRYSYVNTRDGVASLGTVYFDGKGQATINVKINAVSRKGGRKTTEVIGIGPYGFGSNLMGSMVFDFPEINVMEAHYDFVAVEMDGETPVALFGALRTGGINGQLADPQMRLLTPCTE